MKRIKNQIDRVNDYIDDNFEEVVAISQLIMFGIMMLCVVICVIANLIRGNITSFLGVAVSLVFIFVVYTMLRLVWQELQDERKK